MQVQRSKLLATVLQYLEGDELSSAGGSKDVAQGYINSLVKENIESVKVEPPSHVFYQIQLKQQRSAQSNQSKKRLFNTVFGSNSYSTIFSIVGGMATAAIIVVVTTMVFFRGGNTPSVDGNDRGEMVAENISDSVTDGEFTLFERGERLSTTGMTLYMKEDSVIAFHNNQEQGKTQVIMKSGHISVKTDHNKLPQETWFQFPGGGLTPLGTAFDVKVAEENQYVDLSEGKIEVYETGESGEVVSLAIYEAPYKGYFTFRGEKFDLSSTIAALLNVDRFRNNRSQRENPAEMLFR